MTHAQTSLADAVAELRQSAKFKALRPVHKRPERKPLDLRTAQTKVVDERHYTPAELATKWGVSHQTIRLIFQNEPGVLKFGKDGTRFRRRYKTIRIPESVAEAVHERLSQ